MVGYEWIATACFKPRNDGVWHQSRNDVHTNNVILNEVKNLLNDNTLSSCLWSATSGLPRLVSSLAMTVYGISLAMTVYSIALAITRTTPDTTQH